MPVTAAQASAHIQSMNQRTRRPLPEFVSKTVKPVYIYNIYNRKHLVHGMPGRGTYLIPACPEGKPYSEPCVIPGIVADEFDLADGQGNMATNPLEGLKVARDIVGITSAQPELGVMDPNRENWGVFIAEGEKPTDKELERAKKKLVAFMTIILNEGDKAARDTRAGVKENPIVQIHYDAAVYLKQKRDWNATPEQRQDCPGCGENIKPNIAKCPHCGAILDKIKAIELGLIPDVTEPKKESPRVA